MMIAGILKDPVDIVVIIILPVLLTLHVPSEKLGDLSPVGQISRGLELPPPPPPPPHPIVPVFIATFVVVLNIVENPPTVRIALFVVELDEDEVVLTLIMSQELVVPLIAVKEALFMLYSPPTIDTTTCPLIPNTVIGLDIYGVDNSVFDTPEKLKLSGTVSPATAKAKRES